MDEHPETFPLFTTFSKNIVSFKSSRERDHSFRRLHPSSRKLIVPMDWVAYDGWGGFFRGLFPSRWRVRNFSNSSSQLAVPCTFLTRGWIWNEPMTEETTYFSAKLATATWASFFSLFLGGPRYECRGNFRKFSTLNQTECLSARSSKGYLAKWLFLLSFLFFLIVRIK